MLHDTDLLLAKLTITILALSEVLLRLQAPVGRLFLETIDLPCQFVDLLRGFTVLTQEV